MPRLGACVGHGRLWSVCPLSVCLSIRMSFVYLYVFCLSVSLSLCPSVCFSVRFICLSSLSVSLSVCLLYLSIYLAVNLAMYMHVLLMYMCVCATAVLHHLLPHVKEGSRSRTMRAIFSNYETILDTESSQVSECV